MLVAIDGLSINANSVISKTNTRFTTENLLIAAGSFGMIIPYAYLIHMLEESE